MKILQLRLLAFGPFTDLCLDLSAGNEGLHLIYGPNEAGKSTALRAIEQMLYGIPANTPDAFLHPPAQLRIGAALRAADGRTIDFIRRKGRKGTLLGADNKTPMDDEVLRAILGDVDRDAFVTRFGIDHEELVRGGQDIVAGRGRVGQSLFAAGAGIGQLREIQRQLAEETQTLFTPRAQKPRLNRKLKTLEESRKQLRRCQLAGSQWERHERALRDAQSRLAEIDRRLADLIGRRARLERYQQALPLAARRKDCLEKLEKLGPVPPLRPGFAEARRQLTTQLTLAREKHQAASQELEAIEQSLGDIHLPEELLAQAGPIEQLRDALASHRKAQRDLPRLETRRQQLEAGACSILHELRPDCSLDQIESMRLTTAQRMAIQELGDEYTTLNSQRQRALEEIRQAESQRHEIQRELEQLPPPRQTDALQDLLRRLLAQGDLETQRAEAAAQLASMQQQAEAQLARLGLWSGPLEAVDQLPVPQVETVERFAEQLAQLRQQIRATEEKRDDAKTNRSHYLRQIEEIRLAGDVPTEKDLQQSRRVRDLGWQVIKAEWQEGEADVDQYEEFITWFEGRDLAAAYEQSVAEADEVADRLRREADRVARRAHLQAVCENLDRQVAELTERLQTLRDEAQQVEDRWSECWQQAGIRPLPPREMLGWLRARESLVERVAAIRTQRKVLQLLEQRTAAARDELTRQLTAVAQGPPEQETLAALIDRAQRVVSEIETIEQTRTTLRRDLQRLDQRLTDARAQTEQADRQLAEWQARWAGAVATLGLGSDASPAVVRAYLARLSELFERLTEARGFAERIEMIGHDARAFAATVRQLARQIDPSLADRPCEEAAEELINRLAAARQDQQRHEELHKARRRYQRKRETAAEEIQALSAQLAALCQEAGCQSPDELPEVEAAAAQAARLEETRSQLDDQLLTLSGGTTLDDFLKQLASVDADQLPAQLENLHGQILELEEERGQLREQIGSQRQALSTMDGGTQAAEVAEQIHSLLADIETDAAQYARLRLASAILQTAIERYQKANEAPVLRRASELFRQLTLGSFQGLRADFDSRGEKVLVGDRGDHSPPVELAGMSDGTCDQLYLALRLASLEQDLARHEPIPLVVDDILISFDDQRATAALQVLAELSHRTQVVFFTHHEHLAHLAREHLDPDTLFIHHLPGGPKVRSSLATQ